jgi:HEAT repeat protein
MQKASHTTAPCSVVILVVFAMSLTLNPEALAVNPRLLSCGQTTNTNKLQESDATVPGDDDLALAANGRSQQRVEALLRLSKGQLPVEKVVPIMARATSDQDELVRAAGEVGIERIGKSAVPVLVTMVGEGYRNSKDFAPVCGAAHILGVDAVELFAAVQKALNSQEPSMQKIALFGMQNMGEETAKAMDRMIELLDSDDLNVQVSVCRVLEQLGPKAAPATDKLVELYAAGTVSARSWASVVLGAIGESDKHDILGLLIKRLDAFSMVEKQRAMIGLGHMGDKAKPAVEKVTQLMTNPAKNCQAQAAVTLWQITGKSEVTLKVLKVLLTTVDYKLTVLEQLANMGPVAAPLTPEIAKELASDDVSIREQAAIALGKIGPSAKEAVPQLKSLLKDDDALLRQAVSDAIAKIESKPEEKESDAKSGEHR